jgi:hypothetical protein
VPRRKSSSTCRRSVRATGTRGFYNVCNAIGVDNEEPSCANRHLRERKKSFRGTALVVGCSASLPSSTASIRPDRHGPAPGADPSVHRLDVRVACLKSAEFRAVPLPFASLYSHLFANYGVTKLMVQNGANPTTCGRLKEFTSDDDFPLSDVA